MRRYARAAVLLVAVAAALLVFGSVDGDLSPVGASVEPEPSPTPLTGAAAGVNGSLSPTPVLASGEVNRSGLVTRRYEWRYGDRSWRYELRVPAWGYRSYAERERPGTTDYSVYATDPGDDAVVDTLAASFRERAEREGLSRGETVGLVAAFVQGLRYAPDDVSAPVDEYPRYPVETLVRRGGDCEDTSVLLGAILESMGYDAVLLRLPSHMAVGVAAGNGSVDVSHGGTRYRYVETTGAGWGVGEVPPGFRDEPVEARGLEPAPALTHGWEAAVLGDDVTLDVSVENVGTAAAGEVRVRALFETPHGREAAWSGAVPDLEPGEEGSATAELAAPGEEARLVVQVLRGGRVVGETRSEAFGPG